MSETNANVSHRLFSIGHSNHPLEDFLSLLKRHQIDLVVDVRSQPYSQYSSQFNRETLQATLEEKGIRYLFSGKELGGRPAETEFYDAEGHVLYARVARSPLFVQGILRLQDCMTAQRCAMMCSEEDPATCHRHLLVARVLAEHGVVIEHIRGDGRIETEQEVAREVARRRDGGQPSLFAEPEETTWKSIRSVLPKRPPPSSSAP